MRAVLRRPTRRQSSGAWRRRRVLVACVVRRHGRRLPIARFLQFDLTGAGCCERLRGADPERV